MSQVVVLAPQTAAYSLKKPFDAQNYEWISVSADNLGVGENVQIFFMSGVTWVALSDLSGNAVVLSSTITSVGLLGGRYYGFNKDVTAGSCGIYVDTGRGIDS